MTAEQQDDALLLTNVVPMYPEFQSECSSLGGHQQGALSLTKASCLAEIWAYIHKALLKKYAFIYQGVNVVAGPVFDYNYDGQHDAAEPTQQ